ncbi:outer membrane beta-barrel family protein [Rufibacter soli]
MRILFLALLGFFSFSFTYAQAQKAVKEPSINVRGVVVDATSQKPLGYVLAAVFEGSDKEPFKSVITDGSGSFLFSGLSSKKHYRLQLSYLGYETKSLFLPPSAESVLDVGKITLTTSTTFLQEVQVVSQRQLIEQDHDKVTYHVEDDPDSQTLSALEMLLKVPLLSLDGEDYLQLNGKESYQVLINGKTSSLFVQNPGEVFKTMPASSIKSIEVITNPPARYDAEGVGGIINIITHGKAVNGYNGSGNVGASSPQGITVTGYLSAKKGKVGVSTHVGTTSSTSPVSRSQLLRQDHIRKSRLEQEGENNSQNVSRYLSTELSMEVSPYDVFKVSYRGNANLGTNKYGQQVSLRNQANELSQAYFNASAGEQERQSTDLGADYQRSFKKNSRKQLSFSYKLSTSNSISSSAFEVLPQLDYHSRKSQTRNQGLSREHTWQADYVQPIKKHSLEVGTKSTSMYSQSNYTVLNQIQETGDLVQDPRLSNNFDYRLRILAGYSSFSLTGKTWGLRVGGRVEQTAVAADFRSNATQTTQGYLNVIPTLNVSHNLKGGSSFRASYSQRLERPSLYQLDPYVNVTDPRNISFGNPALEPALNHVFNLGFNTYKNNTSVNTSLSYDFTGNSIQRYTTLGEDTVARSTFANIGQRQSYSLTAGLNTTVLKKLNISLNNSLQYTSITNVLQGSQQTNKGLGLNAASNLSYRVSKTWRVSGQVSYTSPQILLQGKSMGFMSNSLSVNKDLFKKQNGSINLLVRNPFQKYRQYLTEFNDPAFYQRVESFSMIRQWTLAFSYRFNKVVANPALPKVTIE